MRRFATPSSSTTAPATAGISPRPNTVPEIYDPRRVGRAKRPSYAGRMLPEKTFEGRVGIITGGGTGIGFGYARELVRLGATVILSSRSEEHLGPAVETLRSESGRGDAAHFHV